jgi:hypothetical protein
MARERYWGRPSMLMIMQNQLRSWALAGVISQGPNTSENPEEAIAGLEIIKARRAHFILPSGRLDTGRWHTVSQWPCYAFTVRLVPIAREPTPVTRTRLPGTYTVSWSWGRFNFTVS